MGENLKKWISYMLGLAGAFVKFAARPTTVGSSGKITHAMVGVIRWPLGTTRDPQRMAHFPKTRFLFPHTVPKWGINWEDTSSFYRQNSSHQSFHVDLMGKEKISPAWAYHPIKFMRRAFNLAVQWDFLEKNPPKLWGAPKGHPRRGRKRQTLDR